MLPGNHDTDGKIEGRFPSGYRSVDSCSCVCIHAPGPAASLLSWGLRPDSEPFPAEGEHGFTDLEAGDRVLAEDQAGDASFTLFAIAIGHDTAQPGDALGQPLAPGHRTLPDQLPFMRGKAG